MQRRRGAQVSGASRRLQAQQHHAALHALLLALGAGEQGVNPHDGAVAAQPPLLRIRASIHVGQAPAAAAAGAASACASAQALGALLLPQHFQLEIKHLRRQGE